MDAVYRHVVSDCRDGGHVLRRSVNARLDGSHWPKDTHRYQSDQPLRRPVGRSASVMHLIKSLSNVELIV